MHNTLYITENNVFLSHRNWSFLIELWTYAFCHISTSGFQLPFFCYHFFLIFSSFLFSDNYNYHFFLLLLNSAYLDWIFSGFYPRFICNILLYSIYFHVVLYYFILFHIFLFSYFFLCSFIIYLLTHTKLRPFE